MDPSNISNQHKRILLIGDMLYDNDIGDAVLQLMQFFLDQGWYILIGDPGRCVVQKHKEKLGKLLETHELPPDIKEQNNGLTHVDISLLYRKNS